MARSRHDMHFAASIAEHIMSPYPSPAAKLDKTPIRVCNLAILPLSSHYVQSTALRDALHWRDKELGTNKSEAYEIFPEPEVESLN